MVSILCAGSPEGSYPKVWHLLYGDLPDQYATEEEIRRYGLMQEALHEEGTAWLHQFKGDSYGHDITHCFLDTSVPSRAREELRRRGERIR